MNDAGKRQLKEEEYDFLPAALEIAERPPSPIGRKIIWGIIAVFVTAFLWACIGSVDEVAVATGKVIPAGYVKTVQPLEKGTVRSILVKDGSNVKKGEVLMELDTTATEADVSSLEQQKVHLDAEIERLEAERDEREFIPLPTEDARLQIERQRQYALFLQRKKAQDSQMETLAASIAAQGESARAAEFAARKLKEQLAIAEDKEGRMKELLEVNAVSDFSYQDYRERKLTLTEELSAARRDIARQLAEYGAQTAKWQNAKETYQRDVMAQLEDDIQRRASIVEQLRKAENEKDARYLRAPVDGTVHALQIHTVGAVVSPSETVMVIVPEDTQVEMEVWVQNDDIGFVHEGQEAVIKVDTFPFQKYGMIQAHVSEVAADATEDREKGLVYRVICRTETPFLEVRGDKTMLSPGMGVTAEIKTREKRIIEYFMDPFIRYRDEGLRER